MNPRKILGVDENATQAEIQRAYRKKVQKHHPDMGGDAWAFQQVQEAYDLLTGKASAPKTSARKPNKPSTSTASPAQTTRSPGTSTKRNASSPHRGSTRGTTRSAGVQRTWRQFFVGELPLQNETTTFILINCLDIFMTYMLLRRGAIEANPIANTFYQLWNFNGMIFFKLATVAFVCVIAQIVARKKLNTAKYLLILGSILVGAVVIYSLWLLLTKVQ